MSRDSSNRGAIAGLIVLIIGWTAAAIWFFLPFTERATSFPEDYYSAPPPRTAKTPDANESKDTPDVVTGFGSMASVDAFVTQEEGYSVVRRDYGVGARLYDRRDFRLAQEKAEALHATRNDGRGGSMYGGYLNALAEIGQQDDVDGTLGVLRGWREAYPESHFPLVVEAIVRMNLADEIRSGTWISHVGRTANLGADTNYRKAESLLEEARELQPADAQPAIELMRAGAALGLDADAIDEHFEYAYERSPQCYWMWSRRLKLLVPQAGGAWGELRVFMRRAESEAKQHPQVELAVVDGLVAMHERGAAGVNLKSAEQWRQVADIFERVLSAYPDDLEILTLYAHRAAHFCPNPKETAEIFDRIGDRYLEGGVWDSIDQYNQARTHSYVEYARKAEGPEAVDRINKAHELSPDDWFVAYHYGLSRAEQNDLRKALQALMRAVETNPSFVPALNAVAHVHLHLEDYERAATFAKRALVREPLGDLLYEAEGLLADAEAGTHADAGGPVVPHDH